MVPYYTRSRPGIRPRSEGESCVSDRSATGRPCESKNIVLDIETTLLKRRARRRIPGAVDAGPRVHYDHRREDRVAPRWFAHVPDPDIDIEGEKLRHRIQESEGLRHV